MDGPRRYRAIGGVVGWRAPVASVVLAAAALTTGEWTLALVLLTLGVLGRALDRLAVFEVSPAGLARGLAIGDVPLGPWRVLPWAGIEEIATGWRGPRDFSALDTVVWGGDGRLRFSSRMGYAAYRALLREVVTRAPAARRTGLTGEVLAEPTGAPVRLDARTAAALGMVGALLVLALAAWI